MIVKYDDYYERVLPFAMSLQELMVEPYWSEVLILATIRGLGDSCKFIMPTNSKTSPDTTWVVLQTDDPGTNPLNTMYSTSDKINWYNPHKIILVATVVTETVDTICATAIKEEFYFSDFCSELRSGIISFVPPTENQKNSEYICDQA